ncbi:MAG TPA: GNAT family N-acetyltransferase [bacterium]|nr:GNAT family N-acetyltransferase [bacterium]
MHVTIRAFRPDDLEALVLLDQICFAPAFRLEYPGLKALLEDPHVAVLVAAQEPEPEPAQLEQPEAAASAALSDEAAPAAAPGQPEEAAAGPAAAVAAAPGVPATEGAGAEDGEESDEAEAEETSSAAPRPPPAPPVVAGIFIKSEREPPRLAIISLMVHPEFRRLGLGRRLVGWAQRMGAAFRAQELLAPLEVENAQGGLFLEALGFEHFPGEPPFFATPDQGSLWRLVLPGSSP